MSGDLIWLFRSEVRFYKALANPAHLASPSPEEREDEHLFHFISYLLGLGSFLLHILLFFSSASKDQTPCLLERILHHPNIVCKTDLKNDH